MLTWATKLPLLLIAGLPLTVVAAGEKGIPPASSITTDTPAYCEELSLRVAEREPPPESLAGRLAKDGRTLCMDGHIRTGITMLRRALALRMAAPS